MPNCTKNHLAYIWYWNTKSNLQVKETEDLLEAASNLAQCMNGQCCPVVSRRRRQASGDTCTEFKDNTMNTFSPS